MKLSRLFNGCVYSPAVVAVAIVLISKCHCMESHNHEPYVLDTRYPVVISEKAFGNEETHFGMSVALSSGPEGVFSDRPSGWVFIGAPTSNSTDPTYRNIYNPGVLWRCSLGIQSGSDTCEILNIDPSKETSAPKNWKRLGSPEKEDEGNSFIGGNVEIKDGRLVTCGPRWTRGDKSFMNGLCYLLTEKGTSNAKSYHDGNFEINKNPDIYYHRLLPLFTTFTKSDKTFNDQLFLVESNGKPTGESGHEWGLGQAGFSSHMIKNVTGGAELLLGAPGVRLWSGAVVRYIDNPSKSTEVNFRPNRNKNEPTYSEFVVGYRGTKELNKYNHTDHSCDYFGYSVSSGRYLDKQKLLYVGGAPRGNDLYGEVVIFDIPTTRSSNAKDLNKANIKSVLEIKPPRGGFGSYFGSVVLTLDIDGDGQDELFVGAPLFTIERKRSSSADLPFTSYVDEHGNYKPKQNWYGDHGSVFVYSFSWNNSFNPTKAISKLIHVLNGSATPASRFGSAISYIKMQETYIMVGAPYESDGQGAIYIYKPDDLDHYVQRILANEISTTLLGFGSSISLPMDIDDNQTPDLAIGAYRGKKVVILRTRPFVDLQGNVSFLGLEQSANKVRRGATNINIKVCLTVNQVTGNLPSHLAIWTRLTFDARLSKPYFTGNRRFFSRASDHILIYQTNASTAVGDPNCETLVVNITDPIKLIDTEEDPDPIQIGVDLWYNETSKPGQRFLEYEATSGKKQKVIVKSTDNTAFNTFGSLRPYSVSSISRKFAVEISPNDCKGVVCKPNLKIISEWFHPEDEHRANPISEYSVGTFRHVILRVNISNDEETAVKPRFNIEWKRNDVTASEERINWWLLNRKFCRHIPLGSMVYNCNLTENIIRNRTVSREFLLDMSQVYATQHVEIFNITITVYPLNQKIGYEKVNITSLILKARSRVTLVGTKEQDTLLNAFDYNCTELKFDNAVTGRMIKRGGPQALKLYSSWRQTYRAYIEGSNVDTVKLSFKLPWARKTGGNDSPKPVILIRQNPRTNNENIRCEVSEGMGHFYFIETSMPEVEMMNPNFQPGIDNPSPNAQRRRRRQAVSIDFKTRNIPKKKKYETDDVSVYIHCNDETSEFICIEVSCLARFVKARSPVEVAFDFFLVKDSIDELMTNGKQNVLVESTGTAIIFEGHHEMDYYMDNDVAQTLFFPAQGIVAAWIYVISIILGILVFALFTFCLYKCGFFKREEKLKLEREKTEFAEVRKSMMLATSGFDEVSMDVGQSREELVDNDQIGIRKVDLVPDNQSVSERL